MKDFSLFWSILVPAAVLLLTIIPTARIYRDMNRPESDTQQEEES